MAAGIGGGLRRLAAGAAQVIRIDAVWLATEPVDMRAGADRLLAAVVQVFGAAQAHHGYLFANARATRIKLLVHNGFGVWCATRRLHAGRFVWLERGAADATAAAPLQLCTRRVRRCPSRRPPCARSSESSRWLAWCAAWS